MDNILAVICARGGSKGVKDKNIRPLLGKPLMAYSIEQALRWGKARHVIVSTDSAEIAEVARRYGAEVPFVRPPELATDTARKEGVLKHALNECETLFRERYDIVVDLDATSPIRTPGDLDRCLKIFQRERPKTLFSVVRAHKNPYFNMVEPIKSNGGVELSKKLNRRISRRQDAPPVYSMNASIYFYDRKHLLEAQDPSPLSDDARVYVMDDVSGVDIDREIDFKYVEFLVKEKVIQL